jgi:molybdopterin synthase catalytic subunit
VTVVRLQPQPIDTGALVAAARGDDDGAIAVFLGTVRQTNAGQVVRFLEYEAYAGMAVREMERIERDALARFEISRVEISHRVGRVDIGETSVAVVVAAPHRAAAMDACRFLIDALKSSVPIWKREHFEGGVVWIEGQSTRDTL